MKKAAKNRPKTTLLLALNNQKVFLLIQMGHSLIPCFFRNTLEILLPRNH